MSKHYIGGTVRYGNDRPNKKFSFGAFDNFTLCAGCNRYIPNANYAEHVSTAHPETILHIPACQCGEKSYIVKAGEIGGECGNVSACDVCETIQTPIEYERKPSHAQA